MTTMKRTAISPLRPEVLPLRRTLPFCVGLALAQMGGAALADSGFGPDNQIGNADNPGYNAGPVYRDTEIEEVNRTPSGQMYEYRPLHVAPKDGSMSGSVEFGLRVSNDHKRYSKLNEYSDPTNNGAVINNFGLSYNNAADAFFFGLNGGGLGRDDQFYSLSVGQYNSWKLKGFYNETPHVFSNTFKEFFTVSNGVALGAASVANATAARTFMDTMEDSEIGLIRKKGGLRGEWMISGNWNAWASASREKREGARPFYSMGSSVTVEGQEPIDYTTDDFGAGIGYVDKRNSFNLRTSLSLFTNDNPFLYTLNTNQAPGTALGTGNAFAHALAPDNKAWNIRGEYKRKLPEFWKGVFSASYSWGTMRQNDTLLTAVPAFLDPGNTQPNWNGTNGVPNLRSRSDLRVDTQLYSLSLALQPTDDLSLKAVLRHYETRNKSGFYYNYNPLTNQFFTGSQGGAGAAPGNIGTGIPGTDPLSRPRDIKQTNYTLTADYALNETSSLEGTYEHEIFKRTYRERDKTQEDKWKLGYVNSALADTTMRVSYEHDRKRGSEYDPFAGQGRELAGWFAMVNYLGTLNGVAFADYSRAALINAIMNAGGATGVPGVNYPTLAQITGAIGNNNLPGGMRIDQADRNQNILNARVNVQALENLDIGGMMQIRKVNYISNDLGWQRDDSNTYTVDFNYQPSAEMQLYGFYTRQEGRMKSTENYTNSGIAFAGTACGITTTVAADVAASIDCLANNLRNPANNVRLKTKDIEDVVGFGLTKQFGSMLFGANYTYVAGKTRYDHDYRALTPAQAATEFPDVSYRTNTLDFSLAIPISKEISTRLMYRWDNFRVDDFHYYPTNATGVADRGAAKFNVNTIGIFLNFRL